MARGRENEIKMAMEGDEPRLVKGRIETRKHDVAEKDWLCREKKKIWN